MFEEIDQAEDVDIRERLKYVRLMRAQFTDTELIFLRYNAMTSIGVDAIHYVNRYNLLKHLPPMDLMEYKQWRIHHQMTDIQFNGLNTLLLALKSMLIHSLDGKTVEVIESADERYTFKVEVSGNYDTLKLILTRDSSKRLFRNDFQYEALEGFTAEELKNFFLYFVKDCVVIQNFNRFNKRRELVFEPEVIIDGNKETVTIPVVNNRHHRIAINYKQYEELQKELANE